MRTLLGFVPLLICVGAMAPCVRMALKHGNARTAPAHLLKSQAEVNDG